MSPVSPPKGASQQQGGVAVLERTRTKRPTKYRVLLHNDDFTSMDFVVDVLVKFFDKDPTEAAFIMLRVHHSGSGVAGVYPKDVAESKVQQVLEYAQLHGMPLQCSMEPE